MIKKKTTGRLSYCYLTYIITMVIILDDVKRALCISQSKQICKQGYYFSFQDSKCNNCPQNCAHCKQIIIEHQHHVYQKQIQCYDRHLQERILQSCPPTCSTCQVSMPSQCILCISRYYRNSGLACVPCPSQCLTCSNVPLCITCYDPLILHASDCVYCNTLLANCQRCSNAGTCTSCFSPYVMNTGTNHCVSCTISQCITCNNGPVCSLCNSGYFVNGAGLCQLCSISNCATCTIGPSCLTCNTGFVTNASGSCVPCSIPNCATCVSGPSCLTCNTGFVTNASGSCVPCSIPNCATCVSGPLCLTCNTGFVTNASGSCVPCSIPNCATCVSGPSCSLCSSGFFINSSSTCQDCLTVLPNCNQCTDQNTCINCSVYYFLSTNKICVQICGDGYAIDYPCDLGPGKSADGCTDSCSVVNGFICTVSGGISSCYYTQSINVTLKSINKVEFANTVNMQFIIEPGLDTLGLSAINFSELLELNDTSSFTSIDYQYSSDTKTLKLTLQYKEDVQSLPIKLVFNPSKSNISKLSITPTSSIQTVLKVKDELLVFVPQSEYSSYRVFIYMSFGLVIFGLVLFCLGICARDLAGLELIALYQYAWGSLLWYPGYFYMPLKTLTYYLWISVGYNYHYMQPINRTDLQTYNLNLSDYLSSNLNVTVLCCMFIPILFGTIFKIIEILYQKKIVTFNSINATDLEIYRQFFYNELLMYLLICNLLYFVLGNIIFYSSSTSIIVADYYGIALSAVFTILFIIAIVRFAVNPGVYGLFRRQFCNDLLSSRFYLLYTLNLILSFTLWQIFPNISFFPIICQSLILVCIIVLRPYSRIRQNIRSGIFMLVMCYFTVIRIYYSLSTQQKRRQMQFIPSSIIIILFISSILALICIIKDLIENYYDKPKARKQLMFALFNEEINQERSAYNNDIKLQLNGKPLDETRSADNDGQHQLSYYQKIPTKMQILGDIKTLRSIKQDKLSNAEKVNEMMPVIDHEEQNKLADQRQLLMKQQKWYLKVQQALVFKQKYGIQIDANFVNQFDQI